MIKIRNEKEIIIKSAPVIVVLKITAQDKVFYKSGTYTVLSGVSKVFIELVGTGGIGYNQN